MRCDKIWNIILLGQNILPIHLPILYKTEWEKKDQQSYYKKVIISS